MLFQYEAITASGKKKKGAINADSFANAKDALRRQKILVTQLIECKEKKKERCLPSSMVINFTRDLSLLLRSGLPLYEALLTIEEKYRTTKGHVILLDLCDQIKQGRSFSEALREYPKSFDQVYVSMVYSAEKSGALEEVFNHLTQLLGRQQKLKKQIFSALIYPIFLASFCVLILIALFFFLIPTMETLFEGRELHPLTEAVLAISKFLTHNWVTLLISFLSSVALLIFFFRRKEGKRFIQKVTLRLPLFKTLITEIVLLRFSRVLSVLLDGGVPLLSALKLSKKAMHHLFFEAIVEDAEAKIIEGKKLSDQFRTSPLIPNLFIRMLSVAEEAGNLSYMLQNIANIYEEDLDKSLQRLTSLLQPVTLLILGVMIGLVLLSVLLPLTDVGSMLN